MISGSFKEALNGAIADHDRYGAIDSGDWEENGAMRAVGIARSDSLRLAELMFKEYGDDLRTGNTCCECGAQLDEDEQCPEGHENDSTSPAGRRMGALLAIVEIALSTGVHIERKRWEDTNDL